MYFHSNKIAIFIASLFMDIPKQKFGFSRESWKRMIQIFLEMGLSKKISLDLFISDKQSFYGYNRVCVTQFKKKLLHIVYILCFYIINDSLNRKTNTPILSTYYEAHISFLIYMYNIFPYINYPNSQLCSR